MNKRLPRLLVVIAIVLNILGCWVNWEAVVKPLKIYEHAWNDFPAPFYIFWAPIWFWHDLSYLLIIAGTIILGYYAVKAVGNNARHAV